MTALVDTHAHLQDPAFRGHEDRVITAARAAGLRAIVVCGYDERSNMAALALAGRHAGFVLPAVGYHPHDATELTPTRLDALARQAAQPGVVAVGEIGLDFYRDLSPHGVQREALEAQLAIAVEVGKPVSVHTRAAEAAIGDHLRAYAQRSPLPAEGRPAGVLHCFGGTLEQALGYIGAGFLISVACTVTYPKNEEGRRLAAGIPLEALVVETDSPYLPPQPLRGKRNEPRHVAAAVEAIAVLRGISFDAVAEATTANACRLFAIRTPEAAGV